MSFHPSAHLRAACFFGALLSTAVAFASTPLRVIRTEEPRFPDALLLNDAIKEGEASVLVSVDSKGELIDALVTRDTHRAFGEEALAAVRQWRFEPALRDDRPVNTRTELHFHFTAPKAVVALNASSTVRELAAFTGGPLRYYDRLCEAGETDLPLRVLKSVSPRRVRPTPDTPIDSATRTIIDFIVDETGRARMPVLVSAPTPAHGLSAAEALLQWQFAPPTRHGEPTAVRVRQEFIFPEKS